MPNMTDRRSFSLITSADAQANFHRVANRLEALIDQRQADVDAAMSEYVADGVSEEYALKEARWRAVAGRVRGVIDTIRATLGQNDETATAALGNAAGCVARIPS